jgi:hypothetical protein
MALGSSVPPSMINCVLLVPLYWILLVACDSAALRQPALARPATALARNPLPNCPVRASAADAFTEVPLTDFTAGHCEPHLLILRYR